VLSLERGLAIFGSWKGFGGCGKRGSENLEDVTCMTGKKDAGILIGFAQEAPCVTPGSIGNKKGSDTHLFGSDIRRRPTGENAIDHEERSEEMQREKGR